LKAKRFVDKGMSNDQPTQRWFIDLAWFDQHNHSFWALAEGYLCPKCRERLEGGRGEILAADLLSSIKDCCAKIPGFVTAKSPILDSIFRLFLANGNQPLDLEELSKQLAEWRGGTYRASPQILPRLLGNDHYYGLRQVD